MVLCLAMMLSIMVVGAGAAFADQSEIDTKHQEAVDACSTLNIITGFANGKFVPNDNVTREQTAKMICVLLNGGNEPVLGASVSSFSDVANDRWSCPYIESCVSQDIIVGIGGGKFAPAGKVTGSQLAKMLLVALGYSPDHQKYSGSAWEVNVNTDASARGFYDKLDDIDPSQPLTREHAAQMIWNALNAYEVEYKTVLATENGQLTSKTTVQDKVVAATNDKITLLEDKFECTTIKGTLDKVKYDKEDQDYNITVNAKTVAGRAVTAADRIPSEFDASKDYSDLIGQTVKVMYTRDAKTLSVTLLGVYPTDDNRTVSALVDDIDDAQNLYAVGKDVTIDDVDYTMAKDDNGNADVKFIAPNGALYKQNGNAISAINPLPAWFNVTLIDNDKDSEYEVVVVEPFTVAEVTTIASKDMYFDPVFGDDFNEKISDVNAYDGIAEDDYVVVVDDAYTVSGKVEVTKAEDVNAVVGGTKDTDTLNMDGTWYANAKLYATATATTPSAQAVKDTDVPKNDKDATLTVVNGFYFYADGATKTLDDVLLVLAVADGRNFDSNAFDMKVMFAGDGSVEKVQGYIDNNDKDQPTVGQLYTFSKKNDSYKLTALTSGATIDMDAGSIVAFDTKTESGKTVIDPKGTYDSGDNQVNASKRVATDATVMVMYDQNKYGGFEGKVVSGKDAAAWKDLANNGTYAVTQAFTDKTVKLMVVLLDTDKVPNSSDDTFYGVILSTPFTKTVGDDEFIVFDLWTVDGMQKEVAVDTDNLADGVTATELLASKNAAISFEMSGSDYVEVNLLSKDTANYVYGAITDIDGDYVTITDPTGKATEYQLNEDTVKLFVDTDKGQGAASGNLKKAQASSPTAYYQNVMALIDDESTEKIKELSVIVNDIGNRLKNSSGNDVAPIAKLFNVNIAVSDEAAATGVTFALDPNSATMTNAGGTVKVNLSGTTNKAGNFGFEMNGQTVERTDGGTPFSNNQPLDGAHIACSLNNLTSDVTLTVTYIAPVTP